MYLGLSALSGDVPLYIVDVMCCNNMYAGLSANSQGIIYCKVYKTVYKIVCEQCPSYLCNLVQVRNDSINLRSKNNLTFHRFKTVTYGKECFRYKAPFYWNSLPNDMKNASSLYSFKSFYPNGHQHVLAAFAFYPK